MTRQELLAQIQKKKSFLCVGLDTDPEKLPAHLGKSPEAILEFNRSVIEATLPFAVSYKINTAFYEAMGVKGWELLTQTFAMLPQDVFVIADAKRGDIGNTGERYARAFFDKEASGISVNAVTVAPYMGKDSVTPFLQYENKWAILLALTSNPGGLDFQTLVADGKPLYEWVLEKSAAWGTPSNLMYVVGATRPEGLKAIRNMLPEHFFLVPGVGAQGGTVDDVAKNGLAREIGLLVNASRSVIYASSGTDFAEAALREAQALQQSMAVYC